jgi:hypothetical protein
MMHSKYGLTKFDTNPPCGFVRHMIVEVKQNVETVGGFYCDAGGFSAAGWLETG